MPIRPSNSAHRTCTVDPVARRVPVLGPLATSIALALAAPEAVLAQQATAARPAADQGGVEEIVVTAQRREQKLQDVGISVTALGSEALSNLNISTATDITRAVPSLKMNAYSSSQVVFNIRGVSQNDYGDQQEPPVAVYQDDSYSSTINLASFPVFDLARVEALRGPQGTLFGRNATGGAIQFISHKPTKEFEGYATATVGRFGQAILEGAVSGPLTDTLQGRFAFIRNKDDGYIEYRNDGNIVSPVTSQPARGANNHYALRGQLAWQPADGVNAALIVRYLRADKERQAGLYSNEAACPNAQFQGEFTKPDQSCAFWGTGPGQAGTGFRNDAITPSRGGTPWATAETSPSYVDRTTKAATLRVDAKLGALDLVSITDYQKADKFYLEGGDSSPVDGVVFYQRSALKQASQEFRLSGTAGAHQIVGGVFGMKIDGDYTGKFADPFYGYDPTVSFTQSTKSLAVFLQDEWRATDKLSVIAGIRHWRDKREGSYVGCAPAVPGLSDSVTVIFNPSTVTGITGGTASVANERCGDTVGGVIVGPTDGLARTVTPGDASKTFSGVTARFEVDFRLTDDVLLFASYNRGSKSGGFTFSTGTPYAPLGSNGSADPGAPNVNAFLNGVPYKPEVLNALEAGFKSTLGRSTVLNASAFYYDYQNYQAFAQVGVQQTVVNLPAIASGLEAELTTRPVQGLTLQLGASALSSRVRNILLPDLVTVVEHDLPQAPKFSGNALARYEFGVGPGTVSVQGDVQYSGSFCFTVLCAPVERERAYTVANARVGWESATRTWEFAAFVNNLFEEKYRVYAFDSSLFSGVVAGVYAKPRTWGLTGTYRFGARNGG
jgi:iron complex outermembrane receptor protein